MTSQLKLIITTIIQEGRISDDLKGQDGETITTSVLRKAEDNLRLYKFKAGGDEYDSLMVIGGGIRLSICDSTGIINSGGFSGTYS